MRGQIAGWGEIQSSTDWVRDKLVPLETRTRVLVLQHPQEQDHAVSSAALLLASLPKAELRVGLSWPGFAQCLGEADADPSRWVCLYPASLKRALTPAEMKEPVVLLDRHGEPLPSAQRIDGVVVLDGSWSQAKTLWWRNPWLLKLGRAVLHPREPGIYGKLRKEPRREAVSSLEAVAEVLVANGEPEAVRDGLRRVFRTMVQRARDARREAVQRRPAQGQDDGAGEALDADAPGGDDPEGDAPV